MFSDKALGLYLVTPHIAHGIKPGIVPFDQPPELHRKFHFKFGFFIFEVMFFFPYPGTFDNNLFQQHPQHFLSVTFLIFQFSFCLLQNILKNNRCETIHYYNRYLINIVEQIPSHATSLS